MGEYTDSGSRLSEDVFEHLGTSASKASGPPPKIIEIKTRGNGYAAPGITRVKRNGPVTFLNSTGGIVVLQFANYDLFDQEELTLDPDASQVLYVQPDVDPDDKDLHFPFAVFCYGRSKFARGNSMPIIIVDKK